MFRNWPRKIASRDKAADSKLFRTTGVTSHVTSIVYNLLAIFVLSHAQFAGTPREMPTAAGTVNSGSGAKHLIRPTLPSIGQYSFGAQSPNVRQVQGDVKIRYGSAAEKMPKGSFAGASAAIRVPSKSNSSVQVSFGDESPNVNSTGGTVEIQYNSAPLPAQQAGAK